MKAIIKTGVMIATLVLPVGALAVPIVGTIDLGGDASPTIGGVVTTNLAAADGVMFEDPGVVLDTEGDFAAIPDLTPAMRNDIIDFSPLTLTNPLWAVDFGGILYEFALETLSVDFQSGTFLNLSGTGTVSATGFDDTPGVWTFSMQRAGAEFSFSSTTDTRPRPMPEPGITALFGIGLILTGLARRRRS